MAWMLMTEAPPHAPSRIEPRNRPVAEVRPGTMHTGNGRRDRQDTVAPDAAKEAARRGDTWVLFGNLERALLQAGMLEVLAPALPPPARIYASGIATVNALLTVGRDPQLLGRGWEKIRANHFLAYASAVRLSAFRWTDTLVSRLAATVDDCVPKTLGDTDRPDLFTASEDGLRKAAGGLLSPARLREILVRDDQTPAGVATAVSTAAAAGSRNVYLIGCDALLRNDPTVQAASSAGAEAPNVHCIAPNSAESPGPLAYLLPGSGGPERLVRDGRTAARNWLERRGRARADRV